MRPALGAEGGRARLVKNSSEVVSSPRPRVNHTPRINRRPRVNNLIVPAYHVDRRCAPAHVLITFSVEIAVTPRV